MNNSASKIQHAYRLYKHRNRWVSNLTHYLKQSPNHSLTQFEFLAGIDFSNISENDILFSHTINTDNSKSFFLGADPIKLKTKADFVNVLKWASNQQCLPYKVVLLKKPNFLSVVTSKPINANQIIGIQFGELRKSASECVTPLSHLDLQLSSLEGVVSDKDMTKKYTIQDNFIKQAEVFYEKIKKGLKELINLEKLLKNATDEKLVNSFKAKIADQKIIIKHAIKEFEKMDNSSKIIQNYEFDFWDNYKLCPVIDDGVSIGSGLEMVNSEMPDESGLVPSDKVNFDILGSCILKVNEKMYAVFIYVAKEDMPANHPILDGYGGITYASEHGYKPRVLDHSAKNIQGLSAI